MYIEFFCDAQGNTTPPPPHFVRAMSSTVLRQILAKYRSVEEPYGDGWKAIPRLPDERKPSIAGRLKEVWDTVGRTRIMHAYEQFKSDPKNTKNAIIAAITERGTVSLTNAIVLLIVIVHALAHLTSTTSAWLEYLAGELEKIGDLVNGQENAKLKIEQPVLQLTRKNEKSEIVQLFDNQRIRELLNGKRSESVVQAVKRHSQTKIIKEEMEPEWLTKAELWLSQAASSTT